LNLRKIYKDKTNYKDFLKMFFSVEDKDEKKGKLSAEINVGFFKINSEIEKKMQKGKVDPFKVMENEFIRFNEKGIKPILIIDELQALDDVYLNNGRDRQLIIELFNFFVAMTKESHLAHVIIASSDGYFIDRVFIDSRLKKASKFYRVDYLPKEDVVEWILNLEKYSKIKDYTLNEEDADKIWNTVGGSMWEIQDILFELFHSSLDKVLEDYKRKMLGMISDYIVTIGRKKREQILSHFITSDHLIKRDIDIDEVDEELPQDMVRNNILYFDPTEATYYPQGKSYHWGIRLYFESIGARS
jgi:AAA+ ATPase superfamily predicted ATPase